MSRQPTDEDLEQMSKLLQNLHFPNEAAYREYLENLEKNKYKKGFEDMKESKPAKHIKWSNPSVEESSASNSGISANNDSRPHFRWNEPLDMNQMNLLGVRDDVSTTIYNDEDMGKFRELRDDVALYDNGEIPLIEFEHGNVRRISFDPDSAYVKKVEEGFYKKLGGAWAIEGRKSRRRTKTRRKRGTKSKKRRQRTKSKRRRC